MFQRLSIFCLLLFCVSLSGYAPIKRAEDIDTSGLSIKDATCNTSDGSITGITGNPAWIYEWKNKYGVSVGVKLDLLNVGQGYYILTYKETAATTPKTYGPVFIKNTTGPNIDDSNIQITAGTCANNGGAIKGITVSETGTVTAYIWSNLTTGENTAVTSPDLINVPPGRYQFRIFDSKACEFIASNIIIVPGTGMPDVDVTKVVVTNEACNDRKGSITGFVIKNPDPKQHFTWLDEFFKEWGHSLDLTNVPAGIYSLSVDYGKGTCAYTSRPVTIKNTGAPVIDDSKAIRTNTFCDGHGAVEGIKVTGSGKFTYVWLNSANTIVSHDLDLKEVPPDTYRFFVSDEGGCGTAMKTFFVMNLPPGFPFFPDKAVITKSTCDSYGSVTGNKTVFALKYKWRDDRNAIVSTTADLLNAVGGVYTLEITTACKPGEPRIYQFDLGAIKKSTFQKFDVTTVKPCIGQNSGSIRVMTDVFVKSERWVNSNNDVISTEDIVENIGVGTYRFYVTNDSGCEVLYGTYDLEAIPAPTAPKVNNVQLCGTGQTQLKVIAPLAGSTYRLYESEDSTNPIDEQPNGIFNITATENKDYYVSQLIACEGPRTKVQVNVGLLTANIPNTFTPNGDGVNDYWKITDIEKHPTALVQVFNRGGKQVYQSKGYAKPFDGTYNGKALEAGSYFYIITLEGICSTSGNISIIR